MAFTGNIRMTKKETKRTSEHRKKEERIPDEMNPEFLFNTTNTDLLAQIAKGIIKTKKLARKELRKRGLNRDGFWIGFEKDGFDRDR